jgi:hypothetical protein
MRPISAAELYAAGDALKRAGGSGIEILTGEAFSDSALKGARRPRPLPDPPFRHPRPGRSAAPRMPGAAGFDDLVRGAGSDGLLTFAEIYDLRIDADLVILSACDTAGKASLAATREAGIGTGGDSALDGLVRAFVGAGGRSVIASHWPVPDDYGATERLITGLFQAPAGTPVGDGAEGRGNGADGPARNLASLLLVRLRPGRRRRRAFASARLDPHQVLFAPGTKGKLLRFKGFRVQGAKGSGGALRRAGWWMAAVAAGAVALAGRADAAQSSRKATPPPPPPATAPGEPIVPDDQFQKELPPLDPDLSKPLEPIDAFKGPDGKPLTRPIVAPSGTLPPVTTPPTRRSPSRWRRSRPSTSPRRRPPRRARATRRPRSSRSATRSSSRG